MPDSRSSAIALVHALAIILVAIALVPAGSHLASLISKMRLPPEQYMVAQRAYDAWALFGIIIVGAILATLVQAWQLRGNVSAALWSLLAFILLCATQVIFWIYTYPMNVTTQNWTVQSDQFEAVRRQWEYSHAVSAVLTFAALLAVVVAVLADKGSARSVPTAP